jgi:hypothetical protein
MCVIKAVQANEGLNSDQLKLGELSDSFPVKIGGAILNTANIIRKELILREI